MVSLGSIASIRPSSARASSSRPRCANATTFPHRRDRARLFVQGAVGPFNRLFEEPRDEMSDSDIDGVEKGIRIERAQTARRSMASIAASGSLRSAWIPPLITQA